MLLAGGTQIVTAKRVLVHGKWAAIPHYVIDCPQGRFELVSLEQWKFALRRGDTVLGIAAMPESWGLSRIELPASLPLATRLFLAMLVDIEDKDEIG